MIKTIILLLSLAASMLCATELLYIGPQETSAPSRIPIYQSVETRIRVDNAGHYEVRGYEQVRVAGCIAVVYLSNGESVVRYIPSHYELKPIYTWVKD